MNNTATNKSLQAVAKERGVKYLHPHTNQSWAGQGQQPKWVEAVLAENPNASLESLEVGHKNYSSFIPAPVKELVTPLDAFDTGSVKKALAATKPNGGKEGTYYQVPYKNLRVDPAFNIRDHSDDYIRHRKWLKNQIIDFGYDRTKPLTGYVIKDEKGVDTFFLTDGFTRIGAIGDAIAEGKLTEDLLLPVMTPNEGTSIEDMSASLFTANSGRGLSPNELAKLFKRHIGYGWDTKRIAKRFDFTEPYVKDMLSLLTLPAAARAAVEQGQVSATEVIKLKKKVGGLKTEKIVVDAVKSAKASGKTKATGKHIKAAAGNTPKVKAPEKPAVEQKPDAQIAESVIADIEASNARRIHEAVSAELVTPRALIIEMIAYIKDVMLDTDTDIKEMVDRGMQFLLATEPTPPAEVEQHREGHAEAAQVDGVKYENPDEI